MITLNSGVVDATPPTAIGWLGPFTETALAVVVVTKRTSLNIFVDHEDQPRIAERHKFIISKFNFKESKFKLSYYDLLIFIAEYFLHNKESAWYYCDDGGYYLWTYFSSPTDLKGNLYLAMSYCHHIYWCTPIHSAVSSQHVDKITVALYSVSI